jgi:hypothetical protein
MDNPAASSAARFILLPEDSFSIDLCAAVLVMNSWFRVLIAEILLLIIIYSSSLIYCRKSFPSSYLINRQAYTGARSGV